MITDGQLHGPFRENLRGLLNSWSIDNATAIPDFMLAEHLCDYLELLIGLQKRRDKWMGFKSHLTREGPVHLNEGKDT